MRLFQKIMFLSLLATINYVYPAAAAPEKPCAVASARVDMFPGIDLKSLQVEKKAYLESCVAKGWKVADVDERGNTHLLRLVKSFDCSWAAPHQAGDLTAGGYAQFMALLELKPDVNVHDSSGNSPLDVAIDGMDDYYVEPEDPEGPAQWQMDARADIVYRLIDAKADIAAVDKEGNNAVHKVAKGCVCMSRHELSCAPAIIRYLTEHRQSEVAEIINRRNGKKETALEMACTYGANKYSVKADLARALLEANADPKVEFSPGRKLYQPVPHWDSKGGSFFEVALSKASSPEFKLLAQQKTLKEIRKKARARLKQQEKKEESLDKK